jgi:hypothetical protein
VLKGGTFCHICQGSGNNITTQNITANEHSTFNSKGIAYDCFFTPDSAADISDIKGLVFVKLVPNFIPLKTSAYINSLFLLMPTWQPEN